MKLKEYNRKNYPAHAFWKILPFLRRGITLMILAAMIGTGVTTAMNASQPEVGLLEKKARNRPLAEDSLQDFHLVHNRLYGSRYAPISRVEADLPLTHKNKGFEIELEWDGPHHNRLTAIDRQGRSMGTRVIPLAPRADMDDNGQVDEDDAKRFKENPFDINLDGRINGSDHSQFNSWVGWEQ